MKPIKELCRELRKNQTEAEKTLWALLRNRKLQQYKFLRQHPLSNLNYQGFRILYIADFYCAEKHLVIEADGSIHLERQEYDKNRDEVLIDLGIRTIRFTNDEILLKSDKVIAGILAALET